MPDDIALGRTLALLADLDKVEKIIRHQLAAPPGVLISDLGLHLVEELRDRRSVMAQMDAAAKLVGVAFRPHPSERGEIVAVIEDPILHERAQAAVRKAIAKVEGAHPDPDLVRMTREVMTLEVAARRVVSLFGDVTGADRSARAKDLSSSEIEAVADLAAAVSALSPSAPPHRVRDHRNGIVEITEPTFQCESSCGRWFPRSELNRLDGTQQGDGNGPLVCSDCLEKLDAAAAEERTELHTHADPRLCACQGSDGWTPLAELDGHIAGVVVGVLDDDVERLFEFVPHIDPHWEVFDEEADPSTGLAFARGWTRAEAPEWVRPIGDGDVAMVQHARQWEGDVGFDARYRSSAVLLLPPKPEPQA